MSALESKLCECGHTAIVHHGVDGRKRRDAGCQTNTMRDDWCRCARCCSEVMVAPSLVLAVEAETGTRLLPLPAGPATRRLNAWLAQSACDGDLRTKSAPHREVASQATITTARILAQIGARP